MMGLGGREGASFDEKMLGSHFFLKSAAPLACSGNGGRSIPCDPS